MDLSAGSDPSPDMKFECGNDGGGRSDKHDGLKEITGVVRPINQVEGRQSEDTGRWV